MTQPRGHDQIKELFSHYEAEVGKGMRKQKRKIRKFVYEDALGVVTTLWNSSEATRSKGIEGIIYANRTTNLVSNIFGSWAESVRQSLHGSCEGIFPTPGSNKGACLGKEKNSKEGRSRDIRKIARRTSFREEPWSLTRGPPNAGRGG